MIAEEHGDVELTIFFPIYRDEATVEQVMRKSFDVAKKLAASFEIIVVDDGSPDRAGEIADRVASDIGPQVRVIHHPENLGYGAAVRTGLTSARGTLICFTDGDDEYDIYDLEKLYKIKDHYDLIITFRYVKLYSGYRQFVSWVYNNVVRIVFKTRFRDISTGLRLIRRSLIQEVMPIVSNSPFVGAEITIKSMLKGFRVGEMGIQTFPRKFGSGSSTSVHNILATIRDLWTIRRSIFSEYYDTARRTRTRSDQK
jgi:glycosyltransferase involved in cell wall biosynthesis